jgi:Xaa-Pro dipeptidase
LFVESPACIGGAQPQGCRSGGGYLPPIVGSKSRRAGPLPTLLLEENMCIVVQPNVITPDHKAGVQFGELVRVTATGFESLHRTARRLFRAGQAI